MKNELLTLNDEKPQQPSEEFLDCELGCYTEEYFHEMLTFERKRSERSNRPFWVMTIDVTAMRRARVRHETVREVMNAFADLTRETDIRGWYRSAAVLGVIFTETNSFETGTLQLKLLRSLQAGLRQEQFDAIKVLFHRFPEESKQDDPNSPPGFTFYPDIVKNKQSRKLALSIKRIMDVVGSMAGLLLFSPFFILIPIGIKLTSRGPVLFRQERVGQYEKRFLFLKFRSMYCDNNDDVHREYITKLISQKASGDAGQTSDGQKVFKLSHDARVTPFGRVLRKTSLDELPQFINVLRGEMSLAGPRPPIPYELEKYDMWHRRRVMEIKPGITGLWQVVGRSRTTFDEMVRMDLLYARNWSLWLDIKILLKTPWAMVAGRGAY